MLDGFLVGLRREACLGVSEDGIDVVVGRGHGDENWRQQLEATSS